MLRDTLLTLHFLPKTCMLVHMQFRSYLETIKEE